MWFWKVTANFHIRETVDRSIIPLDKTLKKSCIRFVTMAGIKFSFCCSFDYINYIALLPLFLQNTTKIFAPNIDFIYDLRE